MADPSHSDQAITGIQLTPEQEDVLLIIGGECARQGFGGLGEAVQQYEVV